LRRRQPFDGVPARSRQKFPLLISCYSHPCASPFDCFPTWTVSSWSNQIQKPDHF